MLVQLKKENAVWRPRPTQSLLGNRYKLQLVDLLAS